MEFFTYYIVFSFLVISCLGSTTEGNHSDCIDINKYTITEVGTSSEEITNSSFFLKKLFNKYGHNGIMTVAQFEIMLENLGLRLVDEEFEEHDHDHHLTSDIEHHDTPDVDHLQIPDQEYHQSPELQHQTPNKDRPQIPEQTSDQVNHQNPNQDHWQTPEQYHSQTNNNDHHHTSDQISHKEGPSSPPEFDQNSANLSQEADQNISVTQVDELTYISTADSMQLDYSTEMNTSGLDVGMGFTNWSFDVGSTDQNFGEIRTDSTPRVTDNSFEEKCFTAIEILNSHNIDSDSGSITQLDFYHLCPAILYQMDKLHCTRCIDQHHHHATQQPEHGYPDYKVWLCATASVLIISLCGIATVALIPIINKSYYDSLLQLLVSLAVGSLSGDALLHLLPHSMSSAHIHHSVETDDDDDHQDSVWHGLTALAGIIIFFFAERLLAIFKNHRRMKKTAKFPGMKVQHFVHPLNKLESEQNEINDLVEHMQGHSHAVFEEKKLVDINKEAVTPSSEHQKDSLHIISQASPSAVRNLEQGQLFDMEEKSTERNDVSSALTSSPGDGSFSSENYPEPVNPTGECCREIVIHPDEERCADGITDHHHHGHQGVPHLMLSVTWMVLIGDGLHHFCDGLAIGAAFADGISSGFSTTVAVFCHEIPHELGDFAMLLKAGMSSKKAIIYTAVLCLPSFVGMIIGVALGNVSHASSWIFSVAGGTFLYVALVDMVPELSVNLSANSHTFRQLLIQFAGMFVGAFIMLLIAVYEQDFQTIIR